MYQSLEEIYDKINYNKSSIEEYKYIENFIIKLFNDGIIEETNESDKLLWIGNYYKLNKKYNEMKKYYLMAIELNDSDAMFNLGHYYHQIEINYDEMKKYYLMAIKLNNSLAMNNLGAYYHIIKENYCYFIKKYYEIKMKKYYLMAIELNNSNAMNNLGHYYQHIEKNYDEMKKYYLMAIELNNSCAMYNLGDYYQNIEKNYDEMKKYYLMAIKLNNKECIKNCIDNNYFNDNNIKNEIFKLSFNIIEKTIICPISLNETNICYITKCNHEFSEEILKCKICPLCRTTIE